jgi:hypothetical protein
VGRVSLAIHSIEVGRPTSCAQLQARLATARAAADASTAAQDAVVRFLTQCLEDVRGKIVTVLTVAEEEEGQDEDGSLCLGASMGAAPEDALGSLPPLHAATSPTAATAASKLASHKSHVCIRVSESAESSVTAAGGMPIPGLGLTREHSMASSLGGGGALKSGRRSESLGTLSRAQSSRLGAGGMPSVASRISTVNLSSGYLPPAVDAPELRVVTGEWKECRLVLSGQAVKA